MHEQINVHTFVHEFVCLDIVNGNQYRCHVLERVSF
jgi:hypothetical protein